MTSARPWGSAPAPAIEPAADAATRGPSYRMLLVLTFAAVVVLTGVSITIFAHGRSASTASNLAQQVFAEVTDRAAAEAQAFIAQAPPVGDTLAALLAGESARHDQPALARKLLAVLEASEGLTWLSYSDTAGTFTGAYRTAGGTLRTNLSHIDDAGRTRLQEFDIAEDGQWLIFREVEDSGYDPRQRPFWRDAVAAGKGTWSEPYLFYDQDVPGISYSQPVFDDSGDLLGVISVDFDLNHLSQLAGRLEVSPGAQLVIFAADGTLLGHPRAGGAAARSSNDDARLARVSDAGDALAAELFGRLRPEDLAALPGRPVSRRMIFSHDGVEYYGATTAFAPGGGLTWVVGAVAPTEDFLGEVRHSQRVTLALALGCVIAAMLVGIFLAGRVSGPIVALVGVMRLIGGGDFDGQASLRSGTREFRALTAALNRMVTDLREGVRARASLAVATGIQQGLLPAGPPHVAGLDVAGHSTYCDETGGDYFDYLPAAAGSVLMGGGIEQGGRQSLLVVCGDVMGHGIGSALLMAGARSVLRDRAGEGHLSLAALLGHVNEGLYSDTGGRKFMTMFVGVVDPGARAIRYASAGHDAPIVYDAGKKRFFELEGGDVPLGVMSGTAYEEYSAQLEAGQVICVGTDGVWEAARADGEMFGKDRLRAAIQASAGGSAADIEAEVARHLKDFLGPVRPKDDVTFVVIKLASSDPAAPPDKARYERPA